MSISRASIAGRISIASVIILGTVFSVVYLAKSFPTNAAWLSTYASRIPITLNATDITADLAGFPITLQIDESSGKNGANLTSVFTSLSSNANRKKIAVTKSDGSTELYVEIERFSIAEKQIILHCGDASNWTAPDAGTTLYFYYDASHADNTAHVADIGGRTEIYSSAYKYLNHLADWNVDAYKIQSYQSTAAEGYFVMEPDVEYVANATHPFQMWLHTNGPTAGNYRINYYYSDNGLGNWTRVGLASPNSGYAAPSVLFDPAGDGKYWMYAEPTPSWPPQSFNLLKSDNQTGFTVNTSNILAVSTNSSAFDFSGIANPHVWVEDATHWFMMYAGFNSGVWRAGLATSADGYNWTKSSNQTGTGGSILFPGERHSDSGTTYKVGNTYYHSGHGNWINTPDGPTDIQEWQYSTDLVNWAPLSGTAYQSFITRSQSWEGNANNEGQTADLCGLINNDGSPISVNGSAYFYYSALILQTPNATSPISVGLVKLPTTFQEYVINGVASVIDSTGNNNDPSFLNTPLPGAGLGDAKTFRQGASGDKSYLGVNSSSSLTSLTDSFTFAAYINDSYAKQKGFILNKDTTSAGGRQFSLQTDLAEDGTHHPGVYFWDTSNNINYFGGPVANMTGGMHRLVCTKDAANARHVYVDGTEITPLTYNVGSGANMKAATGANMYIGYRAADSFGTVGTIDETVISSDVWSSAWVAADEKNLVDTLFSYGSVEANETPTTPDNGGDVIFFLSMPVWSKR